jgi:uncharacterized peroxidase-related enzyme
MSRIPALTADTADDDQRELLDGTRRQLGGVPNLYATMANSAAALRGYLGLREALSRGTFGARMREQLALLVATENSCGYCVAAHSARSSRMGLSDAEIRDTRAARDDDEHAEAVLQVARDVLRERGRISDDALAAARARGVRDAELTEVVAHVALNVLSNYFNHVAQPELDFPAPAPSQV